MWGGNMRSENRKTDEDTESQGSMSTSSMDVEIPLLRKAIQIGIRSYLSRLSLRRRPPVLASPRLLNLGCGRTFYPGWVNADWFNLRALLRQNGFRQPDWTVELQRPLNCESDYWDGIYTEHVLEHLSRSTVHSLLRELHRVLKPTCWVRIIVPDLGKYIQYYLEPEKSHPQFHQWTNGAEAVGSLTQGWGHLSTWDAAALSTALSGAGFADVRVTNFGEGIDRGLIMDTPARAWESLYIEAQKA
jgi:predicted SAM-dependent methyltransferase